MLYAGSLTEYVLNPSSPMYLVIIRFLKWQIDQQKAKSKESIHQDFANA